MSPSPPTLNLSQHQGLFKTVSSLHQVAKVLEFHLQHQSFQWTPRTDLLQEGLVRGNLLKMYLLLTCAIPPTHKHFQQRLCIHYHPKWLTYCESLTRCYWNPLSVHVYLQIISFIWFPTCSLLKLVGWHFPCLSTLYSPVSAKSRSLFFVFVQSRTNFHFLSCIYLFALPVF